MSKHTAQTPRATRLKLWQEITLVLAIKAITLFAIWWGWFAHPQDQRLPPAHQTPKATPPLPENNHAPRPGTR